ncbi:MAG: hypothetical protein JWO91_1722 [Acidobacteriaceae bacterium]|nr:hypothetical protein [Acidobacteriaceae bacterium]
MKVLRGIWLLSLFAETTVALAQVPDIAPQILTKAQLESGVTVVKIAPHFVTTIHLPEAINSVVVGDPTEFQAEHSEREPKLLFVKTLTKKPAETNLLISTVSGHETSLLLVTLGDRTTPEQQKVDFLVKYEPSDEFLVEPAGFPIALVGETVSLAKGSLQSEDSAASHVVTPRSTSDGNELDQLLEQQRQAPLPLLYGERVREQSESGNRVQAGVSRVIDGGQRVVVLFSVVNKTNHTTLLMPPQIQLGGRGVSGKLIRHQRWLNSEQLPVEDFRLSTRRLGPSARADGVVVFERPPYKQSNETLLLQISESGAVDRPALAPIGFGVSSSEVSHARAK